LRHNEIIAKLNDFKVVTMNNTYDIALLKHKVNVDGTYFNSTGIIDDAIKKLEALR